MKRKILLTTIVFLLFVIFFQNKKIENKTFVSDDSKGIVLGESEESIDKILNFTSYKFNILPSNKDVVAPVKMDNASEYTLSDGVGAVLDCESGKTIYENNPEKQVSIASITKLITAQVFLSEAHDLDAMYKIKKADRVEGGRIYLNEGDEVKVRDLLNLSLIASANTATMALVNSTGVKVEDFVAKMNKFAKDNGIVNSSFVDPIGLGRGNISTAKEVVNIMNMAFQQEEISNIIKKKYYRFKTNAGIERTAYSTNQLLNQDNDPGNVGGKTGHTNAAGYCFVGKFLNKEGREVIVAVLNEKNRNARFSQSKKMAQWVFDNFSWE